MTYGRGPAPAAAVISAGSGNAVLVRDDRRQTRDWTTEGCF